MILVCSYLEVFGNVLYEFYVIKCVSNQISSEERNSLQLIRFNFPQILRIPTSFQLSLLEQDIGMSGIFISTIPMGAS